MGQDFEKVARVMCSQIQCKQKKHQIKECALKEQAKIIANVATTRLKRLKLWKTKVHLFFLWVLDIRYETLKLEIIMPRFQEASMLTLIVIDYCAKCTFGTYSYASAHHTFSTCSEVSMHKEFSTHNDTSTCNDTPICELTSTISNHTNNSLATNSIILTAFYIATSGCLWPSDTVKPPGFFKLGSCFSFF